MGYKSHIVVMTFSSEERRDKYVEDMRACFDNNRANVDYLYMRAKINTCTVEQFHIFQLGYWKKLFRFRRIVFSDYD